MDNDNTAQPAPKKRAGPAATKARIKEIIRLLRNGRTKSYILDFARENFGIGTKRTEQLITAAYKIMEEVNHDDAEKEAAKVLHALYSQYRKADKAGEIKVAAEILKQIAHLKGLDEQVISVKVSRPHKELSDDELALSIETASPKLLDDGSGS